MKGWWTTLLLFLGTTVLGIAQGSGLKADFSLERDEAGLVVITGLVENYTEKTFAYSYSMSLRKAAPSGNTMSTQSGSFTLIPKEQKALSTVSINLSATASFNIVLKIFDDEKVVAIKELNSDERFLADFQKLKPKKQVLITKDTLDHKKASTPQNSTDALEIEGLIIDETRSKSGRDFYEQFYAKWVAPRGAKDFTITIRELPARGRAARVSVEINGNAVFRRMVQPRQDIIELLAEQSVGIAQKHLKDNENLKNDLGNGDQQGSGIF